MQIKTLSIYSCLIGLLFNPVFCHASSLILKIDSPTKRYKDHNQFVLSVAFHNTGDQSYIVFPAYIRRKYIPLDGQKAQYYPYPSPVIDPWSSAIVLSGREINKITFKGMRDGDGFWRLEPGQYDLSVSLFVANTSAFGTVANKYKDIEIWRGMVESENIRVNYLNKK